MSAKDSAKKVEENDEAEENDNRMWGAYLEHTSRSPFSEMCEESCSLLRWQRITYH